MRTCTFTGSSIAGRSDRCKPFPITKHLQLFYQNCIKTILIPENPLRPVFFAQLCSIFHGLVARHVGGTEAEGQQLVHAALDEIVRAFCHDDIQLRPAELKQRLTADPATLSLRQVAEAVNTRFVDCAWHSGDIDRDCAICSGMAGVMDALYRQMNEQCAAYLSHITITDIETQLFTQK